MPITVLPKDITPAMRPFLMAVGNADGTVTLYYPGDTLPTFNPGQPVLEATQYQLRLSLVRLNRWTQFKTAYATLTDEEKIILDHRRVIRRNDPVMIKVMTTAGATSAQIDALFVYAQTVADE